MNFLSETAIGILLPFLGTTIGAAAVFFIKGKANPHFHRAMLGFAAGVMTAASVWSLLIPAIDMSEQAGGICCRQSKLPDRGYLLLRVFL